MTTSQQNDVGATAASAVSTCFDDFKKTCACCLTKKPLYSYEDSKKLHDVEFQGAWCSGCVGNFSYRRKAEGGSGKCPLLLKRLLVCSLDGTPVFPELLGSQDGTQKGNRPVFSMGNGIWVIAVAQDMGHSGGRENIKGKVGKGLDADVSSTTPNTPEPQDGHEGFFAGRKVSTTRIDRGETNNEAALTLGASKRDTELEHVSNKNGKIKRPQSIKARIQALERTIASGSAYSAYPANDTVGASVARQDGPAATATLSVGPCKAGPPSPPAPVTLSECLSSPPPFSSASSSPSGSSPSGSSSSGFSSRAYSPTAADNEVDVAAAPQPASKRRMLHLGLAVVGVGLVGAAVWAIGGRRPCC